jgi:bifunctional DNA-binding transcriptional regulator/antitoxin component of YhaV-PrlF toxin-antitoxin module
MKFRTEVELGGRTATGVVVPDEVVAELGGSRRPAVLVTINGHRYRSTVARMGGRYLLPVSAEVRAASGVAAGDVVDVDVELDTEPRVVQVPADLAAALAGEPGAQAAFAALSYSHQRAHVLSVEGAKAAATRERRITKLVEALGAG